MKIKQKLKESLGFPGRLVSYSKGNYNFNNPNNITFFNSNIFDKKLNKLWYGDLDLSTDDITKLHMISVECKKPLYILREHAGRFETPDLKNASVIIDGNDVKFLEMSDRVEKVDGFYRYIEEDKVKPPVQKLPRRNPELDDGTHKLYEKVRVKYSSRDPLNILYNYIEKKLTAKGATKEDMGTFSLWCNSKTEKKILKKIAKYLKRKHGIKKGTYAYQKNMNWVVLDLPCTFMKSRLGPDWCKTNYIYAFTRI